MVISSFSKKKNIYTRLFFTARRHPTIASGRYSNRFSTVSCSVEFVFLGRDATRATRVLRRASLSRSRTTSDDVYPFTFHSVVLSFFILGRYFIHKTFPLFRPRHHPLSHVRKTRAFAYATIRACAHPRIISAYLHTWITSRMSERDKRGKAGLSRRLDILKEETVHTYRRCASMHFNRRRNDTTTVSR